MHKWIFPSLRTRHEDISHTFFALLNYCEFFEFNDYFQGVFKQYCRKFFFFLYQTLRKCQFKSASISFGKINITFGTILHLRATNMCRPGIKKKHHSWKLSWVAKNAKPKTRSQLKRPPSELKHVWWALNTKIASSTNNCTVKKISHS